VSRLHEQLSGRVVFANLSGCIWIRREFGSNCDLVGLVAVEEYSDVFLPAMVVLAVEQLGDLEPDGARWSSYSDVSVFGGVGSISISMRASNPQIR